MNGLVIDFERVFSAAGLAFMAMTALIAGTFTGIYLRPSHRTNAIIMAFGTGALIQALSIDLAYHSANRLMEHISFSGSSAWSIVAMGFMLGGLMYYLANKALEEKGAAIRHPALAKFYFLKRKRSEKSQVLERLSNVELLRSLPPEDMEMVLEAVQPVDLAANEYVFRKGDPADGLYLIMQGKVEILNEKDGHLMATLSSGESFGEMALLTGELRYASARTSTAVSLLKIEKSQFNTLIKLSPFLRQSIEQLNSQRITRNIQTVHMDKEHWLKIALSNIERLSKTEEYSYFNKMPKGAPFAIFLGAMMDLIPESIVIGAGFNDFSSYRYTFLAAVFLANFPEAMASSNAMITAGFTKLKIFSLWGLMIVAGVVAAMLGNIFLHAASPMIISFVEAIAGGAILGMVASVMMPEAYEDGGSEVGLATIAGFLLAFLFSLV